MAPVGPSRNRFLLRCGKRMASQCECVPKPVRVLFVESCVQGYRRTRETGCCFRASQSKSASPTTVLRYALYESRKPLLERELVAVFRLSSSFACWIALKSLVRHGFIQALNGAGQTWKFSLRKKTKNLGLKQLGFNF